ncbi:hypothetical protein C8R45DRAFT_1022850 [Mycena sanguinolenta]|nr:hypothetical protein C8R45DRAFT_1022850 [Mycena sanguinolenta]
MRQQVESVRDFCAVEGWGWMLSRAHRERRIFRRRRAVPNAVLRAAVPDKCVVLLSSFSYFLPRVYIMLISILDHSWSRLSIFFCMPSFLELPFRAHGLTDLELARNRSLAAAFLWAALFGAGDLERSFVLHAACFLPLCPAHRFVFACCHLSFPFADVNADTDAPGPRSLHYLDLPRLLDAAYICPRNRPSSAHARTIGITETSLHLRELEMMMTDGETV